MQFQLEPLHTGIIDSMEFGDGLRRMLDRCANPSDPKHYTSGLRLRAGAYTRALCSSTWATFVTDILTPLSASHKKCERLSRNVDDNFQPNLSRFSG
jgi:hypothetical protein